jgi:CheY-like chemotaxis protein
MTWRVPSVFLSHCSGDKPFVAALAAALRARGVVPWLDQEQLVLGHHLPEQLRGAVAERQLVLVLSPRGTTPWVQEEVARALERVEQKGPLLVVLLDTEPEQMDGFAPLREHLRAPDGSRWDRLYFPASAAPGAPNGVEAVADAIARSALWHLDPPEELAISFAQRYEADLPQVSALAILPPTQGGVALLPQPPGSGRPGAFLNPPELGRWLSPLDALLAFAARRLPPGAPVTVCGSAQLAAFAWAGARYDRTHRRPLRLGGFRSVDPVFELPAQVANRPPASPLPPVPGARLGLLAFRAGAPGLQAATADALAHGLAPAPLPAPTDIQDADALLEVAAQGVALALGPGEVARPVTLYSAGPAQLVAALAHGLTSHKASELVFVDYDREGGAYHHVQLRPPPRPPAQ